MVAELQKLFLQTWEKQRGKPLAPKEYFPVPVPQGNELWDDGHFRSGSRNGWRGCGSACFKTLHDLALWLFASDHEQEHAQCDDAGADYQRDVDRFLLLDLEF